MAQQVIDVGTSASDGTGDPLRDAFTKINDNFSELYGTVENQGLTYGNIASNVAGITFNVTRYTESYAATPVLKGTGQFVGNVYVIRGNVLGGSTPLNDVYLTVTSLANVVVGNVAAVSAVGVPAAPVLRVNGLTGNVTLTVNNIEGAASKAYVNAAIAANVANVTGTVTDSLSANITAANAVISNHAARITTLESNAAAQATAINNLNSTKASITYVDNSISLALSSNAILANVASVNANVAAANAAILLRANLSGANFTGNITANGIRGADSVRAETYFVAGSEADQGLGQSFANPAALFFSNSAVSPGPNGSRYYQLNLQNLDALGSGDIVVTSDDGTDGSNYVSLGVNGSQFNDPFYPGTYPHDAYVFVTGGNLSLYSNTGNVRITSGNLLVPQITLTTGNVIYLEHNTRIRFPDGTIQTTAFGGNANIASINANVLAANLAIAVLQSNAASQALDIDSLYANAAIQAASINVLTANAATQASTLNGFSIDIATIIANAATQSTAIDSLQSNAAAQATVLNSLSANAAVQTLDIANLFNNAAAQASSIATLTANAAAQSLQIAVIDANIGSIVGNLGSLTANAATQAGSIATLTANAATQAGSIATLTANAATQALDINNIYANLNLNLANTSAANAQVAALNANVGALSTNVVILQNNVSVQTVQIAAINSNVAASNLRIGNLETYSANITGATFTGNIQAEYVLANANIKVASIVEAGVPGTINYPFLASQFMGNVDGYYQLIVQNLSTGANASGDIVVTADNGTDENYYLNIGVNGSGWSGNFTVPAGDTGIEEFPNDGYFTVIGGNTALRSDQSTFIISNTAIAGLVKDGNFQLFNSNLQFSDNSILSTANIGAQPYSPANIANYNGTITSIQQALDELAARLRALGG